MVKAYIDDSGVFLHSIEDDEEAVNADIYDQSRVVDLPPTSMVSPVWSGSAWNESADAGEIAAVFDDYKSEMMDRIDADADAKFFSVLGGGFLYKVIAHILKGSEANAHWNANAKPIGAKERYPETQKPKDSDNTKAEYKIIEAEASARGIGVDALRDAILPLTDAQYQLIADIEAIRPVRRDEVEAATDRAGVDAAMAQWAIDLAAIGT